MLVACIVTVLGIEMHNFALFFGAFLVLFFSTGFINGASFRMIPFVFENPVHASLVTGFTAAIAAYGAFYSATAWLDASITAEPESPDASATSTAS